MAKSDHKMDYTKVIDWLKSIDPNITDAESESLFTPLKDIDLAIIAFQYKGKARGKARYQGFDPNVIVKSMIKSHTDYLASQAAVEPVSYNINLSDERVLKYTNKQPWIEDVKLLITLGGVRVLNPKSESDKQQVTALIDMLVSKLGIYTNTQKTNKPVPAHVVTLPKIVHCFPGALVDIFHRGNAKYLVNLTSLGITDQGFTKAILSPLFVALVPREIAGGPIRLCLLCHILVDNVIEKTDKKTPLLKILEYFKALYSSITTPQTSRIQYMKEYSLMLTDTSFVEPLKKLNEDAGTKIRELRSTDEGLDAVLSEAEALEGKSQSS